MTPETTETQENERGQRARKLLLLFVAFSLMMASLMCCGQVALLLATSNRTVDTLSLLRADYSPWGYGKVGVINVSGYKEDLQKDQEQDGVVVVIPGDDVEPGVFWPTGIPTPMPVAAITETAWPPTAFIPTLTVTITETFAPSATLTPTISGGMPQGTATHTPTRTSTYTATSTRPAAATRTPTPSPTRTFTYVPQPTRTNTQAPVEPSNTPPPPTRTNTLPAATATRTPTRTNTVPAATATRTNTLPVIIATRTPTRTNTVAPTRTFTPTVTTPVVLPTFTFTPTHTPTTPAPPTLTFTPTAVVVTPVYLVYPKAENGGISDPDPDPARTETGCLGYFGYVSANTVPVNIPVGSSNFLSQTTYAVEVHDPFYASGLPTTFYEGEWSGNVWVKWDTGAPITWTINGQSATLGWCH